MAMFKNRLEIISNRFINETERKKYLDPAIFMEKADLTSLEEESVANNFANASKVDASAGTSRDNVL